MNRLHRIGFIPSPQLDSKRQALSDKFDSLFNQALCSMKKSPEHLRWLREADKVNETTKQFMEANKHYFVEKRKHLMNSSNLGAIMQVLPLDKEEKVTKLRGGGIF